MGKGRLEAFSDGVLAIIITIMVLEFKVPEGNELRSLWPLWPKFLSYILSFTYIAIYWNNHHHMMHAVSRVSGGVLWTNIHLLFWLSLVPFATAWMGENHFSLWPVVVYGFMLIMAAIAYYFLAHCLVNIHGKNSEFARALGNDRKGKISVVIYAIAIGLSFVQPMIGFTLYASVAAMWFIPDKRFEKKEIS
ncbi:MAG TPA: TMEM175 family protein [Chitinophagaceae bacterium]|nr:TMEM175 family protein [Chitinophagaceae bacterium]